MDPSKLGDLGIEDEGKWMPFIFNMEMVEAAKLTSEDKTSTLYNCTTIFTKTGEAYIIDTPCREFFDLLKEYSIPPIDDVEEGDDLIL